jgi:hypothetical protein
MSKRNGYCRVKGCRRKAKYIYITHEDGDKAICQKCKEKYVDIVDDNTKEI